MPGDQNSLMSGTCTTYTCSHCFTIKDAWRVRSGRAPGTELHRLLGSKDIALPAEFLVGFHYRDVID